MKKLRIFAASPSDMASERAKVETVADTLKPLADNLEIVLDVADWRVVVPDMGRPEQVILDQLKPTEWDIFIGLLWHRFGTKPGGRNPETQKEYQGGTEEEFKTSLKLWRQHGKPRIMIYRCTRAIPPDSLDPDQFKRVKKFFDQFDAIKGEHPGLYQTFDTAEAFEKLLLDNLQRLLLEYGEQIKGEPIAPEVVQTFAPKVPDNLPRRGSFFGRDNEMEIVLNSLSPEDRTWGVLIDGIGGIGKTALAIEAAYRTKEKGLFDAFIFVTAKQNLLAPSGIRELTPPARTLDEFLNETASVLGQKGIAQLEGNDKRRALLDALRDTRTLLIYDNLETLAKQQQETMADFLRQLPSGCKAITTSRQRGGEGAVWLRLERLEWEAAQKIIEEEAKKDKRLSEKLQVVGKTRWQQLHDATGGSPLALVHILGLMRVRTALTFDGALEMLRGNPDPDLQKFVFQEARRELTTNDETALRALSFFVPSASFEAWAEVAKLSRQTLETTIDRLSALSLVDVLAGAERYALHPLTRNFVRGELLADAEVAPDMGMQFAQYWVAYAQRYSGDYATFDLIDKEWSNLEAASDWLWQTARAQDGSIASEPAARLFDMLASSLGTTEPAVLFSLGRWDALVELCSRAYALNSAQKDWNSAGWRACMIWYVHGVYARNVPDQASLWANRAAEAWARTGNKLNEATGTRARGLVAKQRKQVDEAVTLLQEALAVFRDFHKEKDIVATLNDLASTEEDRNVETAEKYYYEALELAGKDSLKEDRTYILCNLGGLALGQNKLAKAREAYEQALPLAEEIGRQDVIATAQHGLARVYEEEGRPDLALPFAEKSLAISERLQINVALLQKLVARLKEKTANPSN